MMKIFTITTFPIVLVIIHFTNAAPLQQKECDGNQADIFFVVDASSSISSYNFRKMRELMADTVDILDIGPTKTRVGVVVYSSNPHQVIEIDTETTTAAQLKAEIFRLRHLKGLTKTGKALKYLRTHGFVGDVVRDGVAHIAIIMTDGRSIDIRQAITEAGFLKQEGVYIYSVGIGRRIDDDNLEAIASDPDEQFAYRMGDHDGIFSSIENLLSTECVEGQSMIKLLKQNL